MAAQPGLDTAPGATPPLVSLIVPVYNVEQFLEQCVQSILEQQHANLEVILVDDGSPDGSGAICDALAGQDQRVKVIHQANQGVSTARNAGLEAAAGEYIAFVDGDDWLEPDFITYMLQVIEATKAPMAMSFNNFTTVDTVQVKEDSIEAWSPERATAALLYPAITVGSWNKLFRRDFLDEAGIRFKPELFSSEGLRFVTDASQRAGTVGVGRRKVYHYRLNNAGSATTKASVRIGTGGLESLRGIGRDLLIETPKVIFAYNHMLFGHQFYLVRQIVASKSTKQENALLRETIKDLRQTGRGLLRSRHLGLKRKALILAECLFPTVMARLKQVQLSRRSGQ
ncbi:MAG: glycosyltransferase [Bifidobacteriaceae bacterium]|jgi:glycosyltransferase involved in cell wall biosynthesis|nr:glycosyltransferase [Bifidobacteriaceae bacterium]